MSPYQLPCNLLVEETSNLSCSPVCPSVLTVCSSVHLPDHYEEYLSLHDQHHDYAPVRDYSWFSKAGKEKKKHSTLSDTTPHTHHVNCHLNLMGLSLSSPCRTSPPLLRQATGENLSGDSSRKILLVKLTRPRHLCSGHLFDGAANQWPLMHLCIGVPKILPGCTLGK